MKNTLPVSILFLVAAVYDGLLGLAFLAVAEPLFRWVEVPPPNHFGYVQFPAALLVVFALMFLAVAAAPHRNRNLIPYGALLKLSYCGVVFFHWARAGIPWIWKPFAVCDLVFLILFVGAYLALGREDLPTETAGGNG